MTIEQNSAEVDFLQMSFQLLTGFDQKD